MIKNKKRAFLKLGIAVWTTPVIQAISLPAHAQASVCADTDVLGNWRIAIHNPAMLGSERYILTDSGNGTFNDTPLGWETANNKLIITLHDGSILDMELFDSCNVVAGIITEPNGQTYELSGSLNGFTN